MEVYNDADKNRLKNLVTSVDWSKFILNDTKALSATNEVIQGDPNAGILFADDATQEYEELIAAQIGDGKQKTIIINDGAMVDVDDI